MHTLGPEWYPMGTCKHGKYAELESCYANIVNRTDYYPTVKAGIAQANYIDEFINKLRLLTFLTDTNT